MSPSRPGLVAPLAALLLAACATLSPAERESARAYEEGVTHFDAGNYDAALAAFTTAREARWTPLIDGMLARTWDAKEEAPRACLYWRSLDESPDLKRLVAENVGGAAALTEEAARRAGECWTQGLGLPLPVRGPATAPVTILVSSEFQCPFCARIRPTFEQVQARWPDQVRLAYLHNPLPFHTEAMPAAKAAVAAHLQGQFWAMHDALFDRQAELKQGLDYPALARDLGLDVARFERDMASAGTEAYIQRQMRIAAALGARGTPTSFINGKLAAGARPFDWFAAQVTEALAAAEAERARGTAPEDLHGVLSRRENPTYAELLIDGKEPPEQPAPRPQPRSRAPEEDTLWKVTLRGDEPQRGPDDALVTVVMFTDFQCPYCQRATTTMAQLRDKYGNDLRLVIKHFPLAFHPEARGAALAAMAAQEQGKFWEMHDLLYAHMRELGPGLYPRLARQVGLDVKAFEKALAHGERRFTARLEQDMTAGTEVQVRGTPNFYINGRNVRGALPLDAFVQVVDQELARAKATLKAGTPRSALYETLIKDGKTFDPLAAEEHTFDLAGRPAVGPTAAPVTIVVFQDFQCPFCARLDPALDKVVDRLGGKARVVYKQLPLSFHAQARQAALAALAAHLQGRFIDMRNALWSRQKDLADDLYPKVARRLKLNLKRFETDRASERLAAMVDADLAEARQAGVSGTPTLFINGRKYEGASREPGALVDLIRERFLQ